MTMCYQCVSLDHVENTSMVIFNQQLIEFNITKSK
jgi:hypothetical protein